MAHSPHKEREYLEFIQGAYDRTLFKTHWLGQAAWDHPDGPEAGEYHELLNRLFHIRAQLAIAKDNYEIGQARFKAELAAERAAERGRQAEAKRQRKEERERKEERAVARSRGDSAPVMVSLPVDVTVVDECPQPAVHDLTSTLNLQANGLINWNYGTIGVRQRLSRRYEGFSRSSRR